MTFQILLPSDGRHLPSRMTRTQRSPAHAANVEHPSKDSETKENKKRLTALPFNFAMLSEQSKKERLSTSL